MESSRPNGVKFRKWNSSSTIFKRKKQEILSTENKQNTQPGIPTGNYRSATATYCGPVSSALALELSRGVTMSKEKMAPETKGVTVKLLSTVDLGPEIEGMAGRQLRMRMVTIEPGGVFGPLHDHKDRPGTVYILQGTITDHRNGVATDYGPGVGWPEDRNTRHWLENRGTITAVEISVDIVRQE